MLTYPVLPANSIAPPTPANDARTGHNFRYDGVMETIQAAKGDWVAITDPTLIAGRDGKARAVSLHAAAKLRGLRVTTTNQNGFTYVRLIGRGARMVA